MREREAVEAKRRIAAEVASLIADGEAVLLDSGTTALEVARAIRDRRLTVLPLSLQAAHELATAPGCAWSCRAARSVPANSTSPGPWPRAPSGPCASTPPSSAAAACPPGTA
nr:hypothetical protein GCM10020093_023270 [Planobispora longispora]